jgi:hypothetical protein
VQKGICLEGFRVGSKASHRPAFLVKENCPEKETVVAPKLVKANRLGKQGKQIGSKPFHARRPAGYIQIKSPPKTLLHERIWVHPNDIKQNPILERMAK